MVDLNNSRFQRKSLQERLEAVFTQPGPVSDIGVPQPGEPPCVGRDAVEFLRPLLRHLSAKQERAIDAIKMIAEGSPKEVLDGERIALARLENEGGYPGITVTS